MSTHPRYSALTEIFRGAALIVCLLAFSIFSASIGMAQAAGGSISGTVQDSTGSAIPSATVEARNTATGIILTTTTNSTGFYEFPSVLPGTYTTTVKSKGFSDRTTKTYEVSTGVRQNISVTMQIGAVTEQVDVSAAEQLMNVTSSDLGTEVSPEKVKNLPLNERNFFPLIGLQPGVNASAGASAQNGRGGFEVNGAPGLSNNILLDGVDATFGETNGIGAGAGSITNTLSIDAIGEFRTLSSVPSAQYGRASGGILTISTKSGTNTFHGGAFEFFRNDVLDANTWVNKHSNPIVKKPELRYNDFGGNIGGPFIRNRAFFFVNYEGDRVVSGSSTSGETATPALIASVSNPQIAKELSLMPAPTSATSNPLVGMFVGNRDTISNENLFLSRADTYLGAHHILARYNYNTQLQQIQQFRPNDNQDYPITFQNAALSDIWTIDSTKVNELRLGLDRNLVNRNVDTYFTDPTQSFLIITGFFNSDTTQSLLYFQTTTYGLVDNFTLIHGKHSLTFGTDNRDDPSRRTQNTSPRSTYASLGDLQTDTPSLIAVSFGGPKHLLSTQISAYAEDNYRVTSRFTLNYGLRYDYFTPFRGAYNITGSDPFGPLSSDKNHDFFTENKFNFAPRVGAIVDPFSNHKVVFRAGFGLMFIPPQAFFQYSSAFADPRLPFDASFTPSQAPAGFSTAYPISRTVVANIQANPNLIPAGLSFGEFIAQYHHPDEYSENWNANVQYQFTKDLYAQISYVGLNDLHEVATSLPNQFEPGTCATTACSGGIRPVPPLGIIDYNIFGGVTQYNGLLASVDYRHGSLASADFYYTYSSQNQTWASSGSNGNGQSTLQDPNNGQTSRGPSPGFQRNRATIVFLVNPPAPSFVSGSAIGRNVLGGWSVQGVATMNSGQALNVLANKDLVRNGYTSGTRPDHAPGQSYYLAGTPDNAAGYPIWLNSAAFDVNTPYNAHRYGNVSFDAVQGPGSVNLDSSIIKHIPIYKEQHLDFRFEMFNVFNHANLSNPNTTVGNPNFGLITTRSDSRKIQFGLKYSF
jgi:carboxypeptidase family protein